MYCGKDICLETVDEMAYYADIYFIISFFQEKTPHFCSIGNQIPLAFVMWTIAKYHENVVWCRIRQEKPYNATFYIFNMSYHKDPFPPADFLMCDIFLGVCVFLC